VRGDETPAGQGLVKAFAAAAVLRDRRKDFLKAFQRVAVVALLDNAPHGLLSQITQPSSDAAGRELRRAIWAFMRDASTGLPSSSLADTQWHALLLARIKVLLSSLESTFGLNPTDNIGRKLSKKALPSAPLASAEDLADSDATTLRVGTVHKAKGESLDAVLYMTRKESCTGTAGRCQHGGRSHWLRRGDPGPRPALGSCAAQCSEESPAHAAGQGFQGGGHRGGAGGPCVQSQGQLACRDGARRADHSSNAMILSQCSTSVSVGRPNAPLKIAGLSVDRGR
jgi:hypothetical protein